MTRFSLGTFAPLGDPQRCAEPTAFTSLDRPSFLQGSHFKATLLNSRPREVCLIRITSFNALSQPRCEVAVVINFIFKAGKQGLKGRRPSPKAAQGKGQNRGLHPRSALFQSLCFQSPHCMASHALLLKSELKRNLIQNK